MCSEGRFVDRSIKRLFKNLPTTHGWGAIGSTLLEEKRMCSEGRFLKLFKKLMFKNPPSFGKTPLSLVALQHFSFFQQLFRSKVQRSIKTKRGIITSSSSLKHYFFAYRDYFTVPVFPCQKFEPF